MGSNPAWPAKIPPFQGEVRWDGLRVMEAIKKWIASIKEFFGEVKTEVFKVSYPTKSEVIGSTTVVILLTLVVSIFLAVMDSILVRLLRWVF